MTTLTLDQAKTIVYSAASSDEALSALREIGAQVISYEYDAYSVFCDDFKSVTFTYSPCSKTFYVMIGSELVTPEQRKAFLESQQQPTESVPAVSTVAEARPDLPVFQESCECSKCKSAHGILNVYAHGLVTVGCPDCWHSDQSLISVMAETFFSHLSTESVDKVGQ